MSCGQQLHPDGTDGHGPDARDGNGNKGNPLRDSFSSTMPKAEKELRDKQKVFPKEMDFKRSSS